MLVTVLLLLLLLAAIVYIGYPLVYRPSRRTADGVSDESLLELSSERDNAYRALADLEFEYECRKISDEDYRNLRHDLLQDTASILARIETASMAEDAQAQQQPVEDVIDAEIAKYKARR